MAIIVGSGDYRYEQIDNWAKVPPGWSLHEVGAVGVDKQDNVYVFNRGEHPMMVFDNEGNFLRNWGEGLFPRAHGLHMAPDDTVFLTDDGDHSVRQVHVGRQGAADTRHAWQAGAVHEWTTVPSLHSYRAVAEGRDLCVGRLWQRTRPQVRA